MWVKQFEEEDQLKLGRILVEGEREGGVFKLKAKILRNK